MPSSRMLLDIRATTARYRVNELQYLISTSEQDIGAFDRIMGELWKKTQTSYDNYASFIRDRKITRLNSSHGYISYAVFCLKKKKHANNASSTVAPVSLRTPPIAYA